MTAEKDDRTVKDETATRERIDALQAEIVGLRIELARTRIEQWAGRLDDGLRFHGSDIRVPGVDIGFGYLQPGDGTVEGTNDVHASEDLGAVGLPTRGSVAVAGLELEIEPLAFGPAWLVHEGQQDRFPRALCRFTAADGRRGLGWTEWNQPIGLGDT